MATAHQSERHASHFEKKSEHHLRKAKHHYERARGHTRHAYRNTHSGPCGSQGHDRGGSEPVVYLVIYRYNGRVYREHMDYDPGEWVRLNVEASPA
jgi:hypothetical protein